MAISRNEIALALAAEFIRKSGVREWDDVEVQGRIVTAAVAMAAYIESNGSGGSMALPDTLTLTVGSELTLKSSGGSAAMSLAGVLNNAARQTAKIDFGANRHECYAVYMEMELEATPTAGASIELYANPSSSATAGTDNLANCSGTDSAYTGYSSNLDTSIRQLEPVGALITTTQATSTVQKGFCGYYFPRQRYGSFVVYNKSGATIRTPDTNCQIRFVPQIPTQID